MSEVTPSQSVITFHPCVLPLKHTAHSARIFGRRQNRWNKAFHYLLFPQHPISTLLQLEAAHPYYQHVNSTLKPLNLLYNSLLFSLRQQSSLHKRDKPSLQPRAETSVNLPPNGLTPRRPVQKGVIVQ